MTILLYNTISMIRKLSGYSRKSLQKILAYKKFKGRSKLRKFECIQTISLFSFDNVTKIIEELKITPMNDKKVKVKRFRNNEVCGISSEKIVCDFFNIPFNSGLNRINQEFIKTNLKILNNHFTDLFKGLQVIRHQGHDNGSSDFLIKEYPIYIPSLTTGVYGTCVIKQLNKKLSLKTNYSGTKVCAQNIGQISRNTFMKKFKHFGKPLNTDNEIRNFIENNYYKILKYQFDNLFCCDYLLWINFAKKYIKSILIKKGEIIDLDINLLTFAPANNEFKDWKSANLKYNGITIGEFQIHSKKMENGKQIGGRDIIQFRFVMSNINNILPNNFCNNSIQTYHV